MNLDTFTPPTRDEGDRLPAKEMVGRPLIIQVREHRTGIKTRFNSDPNDAAKFRPEGGDAVVLDIADLTTNAVYLDVMWFNGAIVDSLKGYVANTVPVKLFFDRPKTGTNPYLNVEALTGNELVLAQQWAASNPDRFERERAARAQQNANGGMPPIPGAPTQPPVWAAPANSTPPRMATPPAANPATVATTAPVVAPYTPPAPAATPPGPGGVDVTDPAIQALLAQLAAAQRTQ